MRPTLLKVSVVTIMMIVGTLVGSCSTEVISVSSRTPSATYIEQTTTTINGSETGVLVSRIDPSWAVSREDSNGVKYYSIDAYSPDGKRVAYRAAINGKVSVVLDNTIGKPYDGAFNFTFSPDSRRLAYIAKDGENYLVVVNGIEGKLYPELKPTGVLPITCPISSLTFSPDSRNVAYVVDSGNSSFVVDNGIEGKHYDAIQTDPRGVMPPGIVFSPDSKRMAYIAAATDNGSTVKEFAVVDGVEGKPYDSISGLIFSPDGKHVAYTANGEFAVIDGVESIERGIGKIIYSPDSRHTAYVAGINSRYVVVDGIEGKHYENVSTPVFSPDSKRIAYVAESDGKFFVVVDGVEGRAYPSIIGQPVFSPDSQRVAYVVQDAGKYFVVVGGKEGNPYKYVGNPIFSPDSQRVAYIAGGSGFTGDYFVVVDGVEGKHYNYIYMPPVFSPDSKTIAYAVQKNGKELLVINGKEDTAYNHILGGLDGSSITFNSSNNLYYLAESGNDIYLVEDTIK